MDPTAPLPMSPCAVALGYWEGAPVTTAQMVSKSSAPVPAPRDEPVFVVNIRHGSQSLHASTRPGASSKQWHG